MSASAIAPVSSATTTVAHTLVKTASGEYTAESVDSNPSEAAGLIKMKDGNYGEPIVAAADRYTGLMTDLTQLKRGG